MELEEYVRYDAIGLAELVRRGEVTSEELVETAASAIAKVNPALNCVIETWVEDPVREAGAGDPSSPFHGVPFLIKDAIIHSAGRRSELSSRLAQGLVASHDSALMRRFNESGLVTLGRTHCPELAYGPGTETVLNGMTRNPWNTEYSTGGSSGGSAASVAAGIVPMAHANDGGGSTRLPASCCGLVGLKPTRGRVSIGPDFDEALNGMGAELCVSRTVRDTATLLDAVQGYELGDPFEIVPPAVPYAKEVATEPGRLRIAVLSAPAGNAALHPAVEKGLAAVAKTCEELGHQIEMLDALPLGATWESFVSANATMWTSGLAYMIEGIAGATGRPISSETLEDVSLRAYDYGKQLSASDLHTAFTTRNSVTRAMAKFFTGYDVILMPTLPGLPSNIGTWSKIDDSTDGLAWLDKIFSYVPATPLFNFTGQPAISLPLCWDEEMALPIGMQFAAGTGQEGMLFRLAGQLERAMPWSRRTPTINVVA